jgi:hypothetical protein
MYRTALRVLYGNTEHGVKSNLRESRPQNLLATAGRDQLEGSKPVELGGNQQLQIHLQHILGGSRGIS